MPSLTERILKEPTIGFKKIFISRFFREIERREEIEEEIWGWQNKGINMNTFYWMDSSIDMTPEELESILRQEEYCLKEEEIVLYKGTYRSYLEKR